MTLFNKIKNTFRIKYNVYKNNNYVVVIYMLHRCSPMDNEKLSNTESLKVSPEYLKSFLIETQKTHDIISLDDLYSITINKKKANRKLAIFTFDDGYLDNYYNAKPIFEKLNLPYAIFVTNCFPNNKGVLWWFLIEDLLLSNNSIVLSDNKVFDCSTKELKEHVFENLKSTIFSLNQLNLSKEIMLLFKNYKVDIESYNRKYCMNWEQIIELSNSNLCTIGSHTNSHLTLNKLTTEDLKREVIEGKKTLENKINKRVKHFAYPFGSNREVGLREKNFLATCGFDTVSMAVGGTINNFKTLNLKDLKREMLFNSEL